MRLLYFDIFSGVLPSRPARMKTRKKLLRIAQTADDLLTQTMGADAKARDNLSRLDHSQFSGSMPIDVLGLIFSHTNPHTLHALLEVPRDAHAGPTPRRDALQLLCQRCWAVERLRNWASNAAHSLPSETTGAHKRAKNHRWLVSQLDAILFKYTKRHVTRSYKQSELQHYVTVCFNVADPTIRSGSIDEAMKAYIGLKPPRGEIAIAARTNFTTESA